MHKNITNAIYANIIRYSVLKISMETIYRLNSFQN